MPTAHGKACEKLRIYASLMRKVSYILDEKVLNNRSRKAMFFSIKLPLFSYISIQTYILMLIETVLLSTHNICLNQQIRKFSFMHSYLEVCYP